MKILFIELCNYKDYPLGGHLSFAKHLTRAMQGDMDLIGYTTDSEIPLGKWVQMTISGYNYNIFNVSYIHHNSSSKPIIPKRITAYLSLRKYIGHINFDIYERIIIQTPEVLFAIPNQYMGKVCLIMPGVENPLRISRYKIARYFTKLYDRIFFQKALLVKCVLAAADKEAIDDFEKRSNGLLKSPVYQFPTRYDADIFNIKENSALRKRHNISENDIIIVTTGRLNWFKGWKLMIDAFKIFKMMHDNSKLYFIGDGEDREKIKEYVKANKLDDAVLLLGQQTPEMVSIYLNIADLFIMGSYKEGWSTSLVEAVACGIPCVVTNFSSAKEMVTNGINGYVIDTRDEHIFANQMENAIALPKENVMITATKCKVLSVQNMRKEFEKIIIDQDL